MSDEVRNLDLDNKLGEGRYGIVCKGMWREKPVAVKRIQLIHIASNTQGEEALQRLDHSNVIKLFHAESDANFR
jgi:serine/threonine protein kinase